MRVSKEKVDELQGWLTRKRVKIRFKGDGYEVWWHQAAAWFVICMFWVFRGLSFGHFTKTFNDYTTTFGRYVYFGISEDAFRMDDRVTYAVLRHELIHIFQTEKYGWPRYVFLYLLALPTIWTWRSKLELEAYTQNLLVRFEETGRVPAYMIDFLVDIFTGPGYLFMCPFKRHMRDVLEERARQIESGEITGLWPYEVDAFRYDRL